MNTKLANWMLVLVFLVMEVNCDDSLQFLDQKKLFETTTVDERGDVRARVVAQTVPSTNRNVRQVDSKHGAGYSSDDEDSNLDEGSGESAKMNDNVAHDEPIPASVATATVSLLNSITPSSTINVLVTVTSKTNDSSVAASAPMSTQASNISVTPRPSTVVGLTSSPSTNTITITQAVPTSSITASSTTVAPLPEVKTDSTTTAEPSTTVSIQVTDVAENKSDVTKAAPTGILETTTETDHEVPTEVTNIKPTKATLKPTSGLSVDVKAHQDPTEKPRETLFGFVTVEILIALSAGALFSVLLVAFLVYRLKKRNEGSYELSETIALRPKELEEMGTKKEVFV